MYQNWKSKVVIIQEGPEPLHRCDYYGMNMLAARMIKQIRAVIFNKAAEIWLRRNDVEMKERCGEMEFSLYRKEEDAPVEGGATF